MAQLEDPASLPRLPDGTTRHLVIVLIETGLRANDECALLVNPIIEDGVGWDRLDAERLMLVCCRRSSRFAACSSCGEVTLT
jgi:hypothetical protein